MSYSYSALAQLFAIGEDAGRLFGITKQREVTDDGPALYKLAALTDDGAVYGRIESADKRKHPEGLCVKC